MRVSRKVVLRHVELGKVFLDQVALGKIDLSHVQHWELALRQVELDKGFLRRAVSRQVQRQLLLWFPGLVGREETGDPAKAVEKALLPCEEVMSVWSWMWLYYS